MVELDIGQVAGVPGDVGDQEAGRLWGREHRSSPVGFRALQYAPSCRAEWCAGATRNAVLAGIRMTGSGVDSDPEHGPNAQTPSPVASSRPGSVGSRSTGTAPRGSRWTHRADARRSSRRTAVRDRRRPRLASTRRTPCSAGPTTASGQVAATSGRTRTAVCDPSRSRSWCATGTPVRPGPRARQRRGSADRLPGLHRSIRPWDRPLRADGRL